MSTRFITGTVLALLAGFVVVVSQAFAPSTLSWVAFGIGVAVVGICVVAQLDRSRGAVQRALDAATVVVGGLLIAFSLVSSGTTVTWLAFAFSLGIVGLSIAGLTLHDLQLEGAAPDGRAVVATRRTGGNYLYRSQRSGGLTRSRASLPSPEDQ